MIVWVSACGNFQDLITPRSRYNASQEVFELLEVLERVNSMVETGLKQPGLASEFHAP